MTQPRTGIARPVKVPILATMRILSVEGGYPPTNEGSLMPHGKVASPEARLAAREASDVPLTAPPGLVRVGSTFAPERTATMAEKSRTPSWTATCSQKIIKNSSPAERFGRPA